MESSSVFLALQIPVSNNIIHLKQLQLQVIQTLLKLIKLEQKEKINIKLLIMKLNFLQVSKVLQNLGVEIKFHQLLMNHKI